ncbi:hypothetical protein AB4175_03710 [Vibrio cyclitrophicus]
MKNSNRFGFMHCLFIAAFAAALFYFILSKVLGQSSILTTMEREYIPVVLSVFVGINVFMFVLKFERKPIDSQTTGLKPLPVRRLTLTDLEAHPIKLNLQYTFSTSKMNGETDGVGLSCHSFNQA